MQGDYQLTFAPVAKAWEGKLHCHLCPVIKVVKIRVAVGGGSSDFYSGIERNGRVVTEE